MFTSLKNKVQETAAPLFSASETSKTRRERAWLSAQIENGKNGAPFMVEHEMSPELAEIILANNPSNRRPSELIAIRYSADMREGNWDLTGDTVKISRDGGLNDGQHRCRGVVLAGCSIKMMFLFGLSRESRLKLDQGKKRGPGDTLRIGGYTDEHNLAHAARLAWQYQEYEVMSRAPEKQPTTAQIEDYVRNHPALESAMTIGRSVKKLGISIGLGAALHNIFSALASGEADIFMEKLSSGLGFSGKSDPAYRLHSRLVEVKGGKLRMEYDEIAALVIKAWNLHREGAACRQLSWRSRGNQSESFPVAR